MKGYARVLDRITLPNRMNLGRPDLPVATDQRSSEGNRRGRHNSIGQILDLYATHRLESISDRTVEGR